MSSRDAGSDIDLARQPLHFLTLMALFMTQYPPVPSYYAASANPAPVRPPLQGRCEADVCVVGAGYTGLSTALFLAEAGFRVVVLEAATVGWGASGRNGGQIVNSFSRDLDTIERQTTPDHLQLLAEMAFEGGQIIRQRVREYGIQCDLKEGGIFAALNSGQQKHLDAQQALWRRFGHDQLELLDRGASATVLALTAMWVVPLITPVATSIP